MPTAAAASGANHGPRRCKNLAPGGSAPGLEEDWVAFPEGKGTVSVVIPRADHLPRAQIWACNSLPPGLKFTLSIRWGPITAQSVEVYDEVLVGLGNQYKSERPYYRVGVSFEIDGRNHAKPNLALQPCTSLALCDG